MCVGCSSLKDLLHDDCEDRPPEPTRCLDSTGILKYCVIAREYLQNGELGMDMLTCFIAKDTECWINFREAVAKISREVEDLE